MIISLSVFTKQMEGCTRAGQVRILRALAIKLELGHPGVQDRDMLLHMQPYIATPPQEMRSTCIRGVLLNTIEEHFRRATTSRPQDHGEVVDGGRR